MIEKHKTIIYPEIGEVKILDIIDEYDFPIIYIAEDKFRSYYMFQVISDFNNELKTTAIKITAENYLKLKTDELSIQDIYRNPEDSVLYILTDINGQIFVEKNSVEESYKYGLVSGDSFFGSFDKQVLEGESALKNAILTNKPTFDFVFDGPETDYPSMNAKNHLDVVGGIMDFIGTVSPLSEEIMFSMRPGSIKLRFELEPTLFSGDESIATIEKANSILKQNDMDILGETLEFDNKKINKLDNFLKNILKIKSSKVKIDFASPNTVEYEPIIITEDQITIKRELIKQINEQIDTSEVSIVGTLTAADKNNGTLKIVDDNNENYVVKFDKNFENYKFVINERYNITSLLTSYKLKDKEHNKKTYELVKINEAL